MPTKQNRVKRGLRIAAAIAGGALLLLVLGAALSAWSNRGLPAVPDETDRLTALDKARLAEALALKRSVGEAVWPGWGEDEIPALIWNRDTSFLVGIADPPPPWEPRQSSSSPRRAPPSSKPDSSSAGPRPTCPGSGWTGRQP